MLFCRKNFTAKRSVDISPGPCKPVVHQRTAGHLFAEGSGSKLLYVCEGSQGAGDLLFSPSYDHARSSSGRPLSFCLWLGGRAQEVLDTVVRGIGFLLMIVTILLLAIAEDR
jgi:hypothetical protein